VCFVVRKTILELERGILSTMFLPVEKSLTGMDPHMISQDFGWFRNGSVWVGFG
jgi:hypothetical protein